MVAGCTLHCSVAGCTLPWPVPGALRLASTRKQQHPRPLLPMARPPPPWARGLCCWPTAPRWSRSAGWPTGWRRMQVGGGTAHTWRQAGVVRRPQCASAPSQLLRRPRASSTQADQKPHVGPAPKQGNCLAPTGSAPGPLIPVALKFMQLSQASWMEVKPLALLQGSPHAHALSPPPPPPPPPVAQACGCWRRWARWWAPWWWRGAPACCPTAQTAACWRRGWRRRRRWRRPWWARSWRCRGSRVGAGSRAHGKLQREPTECYRAWLAGSAEGSAEQICELVVPLPLLAQI